MSCDAARSGVLGDSALFVDPTVFPDRYFAPFGNIRQT
jgi:hypothetical protein